MEEKLEREYSNLDIALQSSRTEEVQEIIDRMPTRFGFHISLIVIFLALSLILSGFIIKYPDVSIGEIMVSANNAPIKLVSNTYGKLKLNHIKSMDNILANEIVAYIDNPAIPSQVFEIRKALDQYSPGNNNIIDLNDKMPKNLAVGELNPKYYSFINSLQQYVNFRNNKHFKVQQQSLSNIIIEQKKAIIAAEIRLKTSQNNVYYASKFFSRDSVLFLKKVISENEFDRTQLSYNGAKDSYQNALNNIIDLKQQLEQTGGKLQDLSISNPETYSDLKINLISSYNDLYDSIKGWEQKYVFRSPCDGKVQFLKFYNNNQFIQSGEQVFTIIPKQDNVFGEVTIPAKGAGKVTVGQNVIIKLDDFPFKEYGSMSGRVKSISLTTNTTKVENGDIETYLVVVDFPKDLKTNYGIRLNFKSQAKGTAEIITNKRRLIDRLFDNLKYAISK